MSLSTLTALPVALTSEDGKTTAVLVVIVGSLLFLSPAAVLLHGRLYRSAMLVAFGTGLAGVLLIYGIFLAPGTLVLLLGGLVGWATVADAREEAETPSAVFGDDPAE